jgi:integrase
MTARNALAEALRDRVRIQIGDGDVTPETKIAVLAEAWYAEQVRRGRTINTLAAYRRCIDLHIGPALAEVRIRELTVGVVDRFIAAVSLKSGPSQAKQTKSSISGMLSMATRFDAIDRNLAADVGPIVWTEPREQPRALTLEQLKQLRAWISYDNKAIRRDIPDLVDFLMCTGVRIGEACGLTWGAINLDEGWCEVRSTVVRQKGKGLVNQSKPKTKAGFRKLALPSWMIEILRARFVDQGDDVAVFPAPRGGLRDGSNTQADLRDAFGAAGFEWATSHIVGRKSVASLMDMNGLSARAAADQLGQEGVALVQDRYYGRKLADTGAAALLEALVD